MEVNARIENQIAVILREIGVAAHLRGWRYLLTGIELTLQDEGMIHAMTKRLYPEIAAKHGVTSTKVERAIRNAIETAWTTGDLEMQHRYFGSSVSADKGKPTNAAFIAGIAEYLRLRYGKLDE